MNLLTLDYETFYDDTYSLSKMTTEAYVRDPRFEMILVSVKWNDQPAFWVLRQRFEHFVKNEVDWATTAVVAHHSHFDGLILAHHFGCKPAMWIDTLSMARAVDGPKLDNSLEGLCRRHNVGAKGNYVTFAKGKHLADFTVPELHDYGQYSCNDSDRTYDLAQIFIPRLPAAALQVIDLTIRMFTEPVLLGDTAMLAGAVQAERERKIGLLQRVGAICPFCTGSGQTFLPGIPEAQVCKKCDGTAVDKKLIGSNERFANLLRGFGVEPETKDSPTAENEDGTPKRIYAFAKTDPAMQELLEDPEEEVRFLAEARIAVKSALIETRAQRFHDCASRGVMPVYIKAFAAHTQRTGGGDGMNWQNLAGVNVLRPEMSVLSASVHAPAGSKIVRVDSGQGEARILAYLANQMGLLEAFAQGRDVYSEHASTIYNRPVDRKNVEADHIPGQLGKVSILGMGYSMGWYKAAMELLKGMLGAPPIQFTIADMENLQVDPSRFLANPKNVQRVSEMPSRLGLNDRLIHCAVTKAIVDRYRAKMSRISGVGLPAGEKGFWDIAEDAITAMIEGREMVFGAHGILRTGHECVYGPNGLQLNYPGIVRSNGEASYFDGRKRTHIYGGLFTENLVQWLHFIAVCEQMLEINQVLKVALMRHDDVVCVVPDEAAEAAKQYMIQVMGTTPTWAPGLPLKGEGKIGQTLLEVK